MISIRAREGGGVSAGQTTVKSVWTDLSAAARVDMLSVSLTSKPTSLPDNLWLQCGDGVSPASSSGSGRCSFEHGGLPGAACAGELLDGITANPSPDSLRRQIGDGVSADSSGNMFFPAAPEDDDLLGAADAGELLGCFKPNPSPDSLRRHTGDGMSSATAAYCWFGWLVLERPEPISGGSRIVPQPSMQSWNF